MTKFKKKSTLQVISVLDTFAEKCPRAPACHQWDDFWDFSRMSVPKDSVSFYRRLNCSRFIGNYISIYFFTVFILGVFVNRYFLIPLIILPMIWIIICIATEVENYNKNKREKEYIIPFNQRVSNGGRIQIINWYFEPFDYVSQQIVFFLLYWKHFVENSYFCLWQ